MWKAITLEPQARLKVLGLQLAAGREVSRVKKKANKKFLKTMTFLGRILVCNKRYLVHRIFGETRKRRMAWDRMARPLGAFHFAKIFGPTDWNTDGTHESNGNFFRIKRTTFGDSPPFPFQSLHLWKKKNLAISVLLSSCSVTYIFDLLVGLQVWNLNGGPSLKWK